MKYKYLLPFLICLLSLSSCSLTIRKMMKLNHMKVESAGSISDIIVKNGADLQNHYILKSSRDSISIFKNAFRCFNNDILLFDSEGNKLCFEGDDKCTSAKEAEAFKNFNTYYKLCNNDSITLSLISKDFVPLSEVDQLTVSELYLVVYWSNFYGGKNRLKNEIEYYRSLQSKSSKKIKLLFVNTDLQESWGLEEGKKMKVKLKYTGNKSMNLKFSKIPYSNDNLSNY